MGDGSSLRPEHRMGAGLCRRQGGAEQACPHVTVPRCHQTTEGPPRAQLVTDRPQVQLWAEDVSPGATSRLPSLPAHIVPAVWAKGLPAAPHLPAPHRASPRPAEISRAWLAVGLALSCCLRGTLPCPTRAVHGCAGPRFRELPCVDQLRQGDQGSMGTATEDSRVASVLPASPSTGGQLSPRAWPTVALLPWCCFSPEGATSA